MTRLFSFAGVVLAALGFGIVASGQDANPRPMPTLVPQPGANVFRLGRGVQAYPMLQMENVQKELGLTPEQKEKLKDLASKDAESVKAEPRIDWAKFRDMSPEERQKAQKEMSDRNAKRTEESRKAVQEILTTKQVEQLKDMDFRQRVTSLLYMPQVLQQIELTDEQKQQMQKIREESLSKMAQLQRESQEKTLKVLTPEQTKKLKELSEKGWSAWGQPVPTLQPEPAQKLTEADDGKTVAVKVGDLITISLKGNPTTGYSWRTAKLDGKAIDQMGDPKYTTNPHRPGMVGVGGTFVFKFKAAKPGKTQISLEYVRPWEKNTKPVKTFAVTIEVEEK